MKKNLVLALGLCSLVLFTGCKSRESAYRQAYEQAMANNDNKQDEQQVEISEKTEKTETVVVSTPQTPVTVTEDHTEVREIQGALSVVSGNPLKTYSVVVGSFLTQANAEGESTRLQSAGYESRVVKTNETINGKIGWFRVIASSFDDKSSAVQSRNSLRSKYPGAWLLFRK